MVTSETGAAVTLVSAGGISETLLRSDLESLSTTGLSLMPEGFEQILKPQDVADLLAYLDSVAVPPKVFPGNHPSIVTLDSNRAARLLASVCEIHGDGLVFETPYRNLGSWNGISSRAVWTVELPADGVYEVWMQWACPAESAGNRLRLQVGDQIITHKVGATASWDEYLVAKLGEVKLSPGRHRVVMQPAEGLKGWLLDLAEIRLVPAGQAGVPAFVPPGRVAGAR